MTGGLQTIGANERLGVLEIVRRKTVAAAGTSQTDAALIGANVTVVTGASSSNGVILRKTKNNPYTVLVYSSAATNALKVYPPVGGNFNDGVVNTPLSATAQTPYYLSCISGDGLSWIYK